MKRLDTNPFLESIRAAYRKSAMYARINESAPQAQGSAAPERRAATPTAGGKPAAADLPLGIELDDFERELGERANP